MAARGPAASARRSAVPVLLIDTNVILDVILQRAPWAADATLVLDAIGRGVARGLVAGHAVTTVHYIVEREVDRTAASLAVGDLLQLLTVVPLDGSDFQGALGFELRDYEDAAQVMACRKAGASILVTRNGRDFKGAPVTPYTPGEVLALLRTAHGLA